MESTANEWARRVLTNDDDDDRGESIETDLPVTLVEGDDDAAVSTLVDRVRALVLRNVKPDEWIFMLRPRDHVYARIRDGILCEHDAASVMHSYALALRTHIAQRVRRVLQCLCSDKIQLDPDRPWLDLDGRTLPQPTHGRDRAPVLTSIASPLPTTPTSLWHLALTWSSPGVAFAAQRSEYPQWIRLGRPDVDGNGILARNWIPDDRRLDDPPLAIIVAAGRRLQCVASGEEALRGDARWLYRNVRVDGAQQLGLCYWSTTDDGVPALACAARYTDAVELQIVAMDLDQFDSW